MFYIVIKEMEDGLFTNLQDMDNIHQALMVQFQQERFLAGFHKGFSTNVRLGEIEFLFKGLVFQEPAACYVMRRMDEILQRAGIRDICCVSGFGNRLSEGDQSIPIQWFKPEETINSNLIKGSLDESQIPDSYLCQLSYQVMDDPVCTRARPDIFYNRNHLLYWVYSQLTMTDPFTKTMLDPRVDIISDENKKAEINAFVKEKLITGLQEKKQKFVNIVKKYANEVTQANIDKAFRSAAAVNNLEDLKILYNKIINVNAQDDNPQRRRTALHWAIDNSAIECTEWLLEIAKAKMDIPDAKGHTAYDYANRSDSGEIRQLFGIEIEQQIQRLAL